MKGRCYRQSMKGYENYGGRGISVCDAWKNSFTAFRDWAIENGYDETAGPRECTLDRIDVNGNYCPENCRWISNKEQQSNRQDNVYIEYKGERKTIAGWAEYCGIGYKGMEKRFRKWSVEDAIETPVLKREDRRGRKHKGERAVIQLTKDGRPIKKFRSVSEAARSIGRPVSEITSVCRRRKNRKGYQFKTCAGFVWQYESEMVGSEI